MAAIPAKTADSSFKMEHIYKANVTASPVLITRGPNFTMVNPPLKALNNKSLQSLFSITISNISIKTNNFNDFCGIKHDFGVGFKLNKHKKALDTIRKVEGP